MDRQLLEELAAIFDKDQGVSAPLKVRKRVPSGSARQDEIWAIEAMIEQFKAQHALMLARANERLANEIAPFVARLEQLKREQA